jgi:hypothetical protein
MEILGYTISLTKATPALLLAAISSALWASAPPGCGTYSPTFIGCTLPGTSQEIAFESFTPSTQFTSQDIQIIFDKLATFPSWQVQNMRHLSIILLCGSSISASASAQSSTTALDRMIAAGKSRRELAQYLFDTHGCKECHTIGHDGKLGYTKKGEERAKGFEGCISTLKAMSIIAKAPEDQRSATQRRPLHSADGAASTTPEPQPALVHAARVFTYCRRLAKKITPDSLK